MRGGPELRSVSTHQLPGGGKQLTGVATASILLTPHMDAYSYGYSYSYSYSCSYSCSYSYSYG